MAHKVDQDTGAAHVATCSHPVEACASWRAKGDTVRGVRDGDLAVWCGVCGALSAGGGWREPLRASLLRAALRVVVEASEFQARAAAVLDAARGTPADLAAFREGVEGVRRRSSDYEAAAFQRVARTLDPQRTAGVTFTPIPSCALYSECVLPSGHAGRCLSVVLPRTQDDHT